jgi:ferric-dicitrate binding protein FerR (iron transport regulator)
MDEEKLYHLLEQYYLDNLAPEDETELHQVLDTQDYATLSRVMTRMLENHVSEEDHQVSETFLRENIERILSTDRPVRKHVISAKSNFSRYKYAISAAAAIIFFCGIALFYHQYINRESDIDRNMTIQQDHDFMPGKDGAILTLSDGTQVILDSLGNSTRTLAIDGVKIVYLDEGQSKTTIYNSMETPKGRQYHLTLSDGTKVWLNAASSITYPVSFASDTREVTISGEVYFEVSPMKNKPFHVHVKDNATTIEVLGTHFNINAYGDEGDIRTTLLEGKVNIAHQGSTKILSPGQQSITSENQSQIMVRRVTNPGHILAWKENLFSFENVTLDLLMKELGRWYDFDVQFEGSIPKYTFSGKIGKKLTLQQVMSLLGATNIKYYINHEKQITIYNKH